MIGLQGIGTAMSIAGSIQSGYNQRAYNNAQAGASIRQGNEDLYVAGQNQTAVQDQAARDTSMLDSNVRRVSGTQVASEAANGAGLNSTTAEAVARDTFNRQKLDEAAIRYNADQKTRAIGDQAAFEATEEQHQADMYKQAGSNAVGAGWMNAGTSLLGGATAMGSSWYKYNGGKWGTG